MLWLIAIGCFIAIVYIGLWQKRQQAKRELRMAEIEYLADQNHKKEELVREVDDLQNMIKDFTTRIREKQQGKAH